MKMNTIHRFFACLIALLIVACNTAVLVVGPTDSPTGQTISLPTSLPTQAPRPRLTPPITALPLAQQVTLSTITANESGKAPDYTLQVQIPVLTTAQQDSDPRVKKFNTEVTALIQGATDQFRKGLAEQPSKPISGGSYFDVRYALISSPGKNFISLQFKIEGMSDGAAHPYHITLSFNYDLEKGEQIKLSQLFLHGVNHLQTIADYCRTELSKRDIGFEGFSEGADPTDENYAVWNLSPEGLLIVFNEYQVAAYAAGPQSVIIPFEKLDNIINPGEVLAGWRR